MRNVFLILIIQLINSQYFAIVHPQEPEIQDGGPTTGNTYKVTELFSILRNALKKRKSKMAAQQPGIPITRHVHIQDSYNFQGIVQYFLWFLMSHLRHCAIVVQYPEILVTRHAYMVAEKFQRLQLYYQGLGAQVSNSQC